MKDEKDYQIIATELNHLIKDYNALTLLIQKVKNRWISTHPEDTKYKLCDLLNGTEDKKGNLKKQGLEQIKGRQTRKLEKYLLNFPIYTDWLKKFDGIGPAIAGGLIRLYYFKFIPVCQCGEELVKQDQTFWCPQCNKSVKGDGPINHKVELRDFPTISSWWHFMGRHNDGNGKMPKRAKGIQSNWSQDGRRLGFQIRESFNRGSTKYREYADKRKQYRELTHPDARKGYRHNMAWNETVKLFLSHFWQVAHEIDGLPMTEPWSVAHGGHDPDHIIPPYYWNGN